MLAGFESRYFVRDYGPGIPELFQAKIFTEFKQGDSAARQHSGVGLDLHIGQCLVQPM